MPTPKPLRAEEEWVRQCIEAELPGSRVVQYDDNIVQSGHDLEIFYGERRSGAVEVSGAVDPKALQLWKLVGDPHQWASTRLAGGWMITLRSNASAKRLESELHPLLDLLETRGLNELELNWLDTDGDEAAAAARAMGIVSLRQYASQRPGSVYFSIEQDFDRMGGVVPDHSDDVPRWLTQWLRRADQEDNRRKLSRSGAPERHMAIVLHGYTPAPFEVVYALLVDGRPLPTTAPDLPPEITHCWILTSWRDGQGLRWSPDGWTHFSKLQS